MPPQPSLRPSPLDELKGVQENRLTPDYVDALATHETLAVLNFVLLSIADLALLPAAIALFLVLRKLNSTAVLIAATLIILGVVLDFAIAELNSLLVVMLQRTLTSLPIGSDRASVYEAAQMYARQTLPIGTFCSYVIPSSGYLLAAFVMRKGVFNPGDARLGIVAGVLGVVGGFYVFAPVLALCLMPCLAATAAWFVVIGWRFYRLGGPGVQSSIETSVHLSTGAMARPSTS